jgi:hypothetical protein
MRWITFRFEMNWCNWKHVKNQCKRKRVPMTRAFVHLFHWQHNTHYSILHVKINSSHISQNCLQQIIFIISSKIEYCNIHGNSIREILTNPLDLPVCQRVQDVVFLSDCRSGIWIVKFLVNSLDPINTKLLNWLFMNNIWCIIYCSIAV